MPRRLGTRTRQNNQQMFIDQGTRTRSRNTDKGMKKRVVAALTFSGATAKVTGLAGTFAGTFVVGDPVQISGTNLNNSFHEVTATNNDTFLQLAPPPKDEGPVTAQIRTP